MKLVKKTVAFLLAAALCGGALAGCGPKTGDPDKTVTICLNMSDQNLFNPIIAAFEAKFADKGWKVEPTWAASGTVVDKQNTLVATRRAPSVILGGDVHLATQRRLLLPLDDLIARDDDEVQVDDFFPEVIERLRADGQTYYLSDYYQTSLLYYNKTLFDNDELAIKAALNANTANPLRAGPATTHYPAPDWNLDDLTNVGRVLTKRVGSAVTQWGVGATYGYWGEWLVHVKQAGGDVMGADGFVSLNTPEAIAGLTVFRDKALGVGSGEERWNKKISPAPGENDLGHFVGGKTAIGFSGHVGEWPTYKAMNNFNWDVEILPVGLTRREGGEFAINGYGVYKDASNPEAAWEFIKMLTGKRDSAELLNFGYLTPRKSGRDATLAVPKAERPAPQNMEAAFDSVLYGSTLPSYSYFQYVEMTIIEPSITSMLEGMPPAQAAAEATDNANKYIRTIL
ncbi:MAG: extracellular solute-binding protein [Clostridiales bacterium]|jgi:ABC-type glycerol-3-phosphate transport system substrate-binding protein|nr:extracellular solute-binding protein [Clostridiales bacterium]